MRAWCANLATDRTLIEAEYERTSAEAVTGRIYIHPTTRAKLTYGASLGIIEQFCASLVSKHSL
jgi:hypothetical protein